MTSSAIRLHVFLSCLRFLFAWRVVCTVNFDPRGLRAALGFVILACFNNEDLSFGAAVCSLGVGC